MSLLARRSGGEQTHTHASSYTALFPGAAVSSSLGPDNRGFLIGLGWTWQIAGHFPCSGPQGPSPLNTPLCGGGGGPGKQPWSPTKHWEPASYMGARETSHPPHRGTVRTSVSGSVTLPPPWAVSHLAMGSSPPPSRRLLHGHLVSTEPFTHLCSAVALPWIQRGQSPSCQRVQSELRLPGQPDPLQGCRAWY